MLNQEQRERIIALRKCGYSYRKIREITGISKVTIGNVVNGKVPTSRKPCNDLIWRAVKVKTTFTSDDIETLSGCAFHTVKVTLKKLKDMGVIKHAGTEGRKNKYRLHYNFRKYGSFPVKQKAGNQSEIILLADSINNMIKSGIYMVKSERSQCIELCRELITKLEEINDSETDA